jgi:ketosteroid isomerase-like protein
MDAPRSNAEIVRRAWEAWWDKDMDAVVASWHPDVEWDLTAFDEAPPGMVIRGAENVLQLIVTWLRRWESYEARVLEVVEAGDDVLLLVERRARAAGTGAEADRIAAQVWTFDQGRIRRIRSFSRVADARVAAGL